jgi:hypothetical protein
MDTPGPRATLDMPFFWASIHKQLGAMKEWFVTNLFGFYLKICVFF